MCYFIVLMSSLLFYNVEKSFPLFKKKKKIKTFDRMSHGLTNTTPFQAGAAGRHRTVQWVEMQAMQQKHL